jgi:type II secretory pathway pseudopilin PulG
VRSWEDMNNLYKISSTRYRASNLQHRASRIKHPESLIPHPATRKQMSEDRGQRAETIRPQIYNINTICLTPCAVPREPCPAPRNPHPSPGFTLIEILLAFLILAIVMTTLLASFNAVFSTTDTLENSSKYYDMAKNCLNRMILDLDAVYVTQPPFYKKPEFDAPPDSYRIVGSNSDISGIGFATLRFTSNAHIALDKSGRQGIAEIVYYVQAKSDGQLVLKRGDQLYPYPTFEERAGDPVMCQRVKSLAFKYYDAEGAESEVWDSDSRENNYATPTAIGIQLEIGNETESYAFETTVRLAAHRKKLE